ncbi:MAG TPA: HAMP domain-containing sensor histidine kinase [candidate division Zixibacteria bacterium]|nr:HAMP domain-containing sensor histidine kinase [candidate division Zixibacteria bacterium]
MSQTPSRARRSVDSLYVGKSTIFKMFLLGGVLLISGVFIWYTFNVIDKLKEDTRSNVEKYVKMWQLAANSNVAGTELQFIFDEIIVKANFPIIVLDQNREPIHSRNVDHIQPDDTTAATREFLKQVAEQMLHANGEFPLMYENGPDTFVNYLLYGDSKVINQLKMMPFVEIGIILAFMAVAIIGFQNIRRSEERHIWVGMAKETAHQLGTPISSLMGWLEVMDSERDCFSDEQKKLVDDTLGNMKVDVVRLQKVANRFGKIGSIPDLVPCDLNGIVQETVDYYSRRLPFEGKGIRILFESSDIPMVNLNPELFGWALENMMKNALQAVDSRTGVISLATTCTPGSHWVTCDIKDNGQGITTAAARKIFRAGFTTKKRGWGLGLTLVKRIIEEYHAGRVILKKSRPGETIFEIYLPVVNNA